MRRSVGSILGVLLGLALPAELLAQSTGAGTAPAQTAQSTPVASYVPPLRGAPDARISGATRGRTNDLMTLDVIAPDHIGRTLQEQPTLYWFNSLPIAGAVEVTLVADESGKTLLDVSLPGPIAPGIHAFPLVGTAARLNPSEVVQWSVTEIVSKTEPSRNAVASGMLERFTAGELKTPAAPAGRDAAASYARAGIWYDAIDALSQDIQRSPADADLHRFRADLLAQVGLKDAAEFDRSTASR